VCARIKDMQTTTNAWQLVQLILIENKNMDFINSEFLMAGGLSDQLPQSTHTELVFCGRSNVGKSSLINKLCNRKSLARVSGTPGKTTTINFFSLGKNFVLVDLPGYGYAKRSHSEKERWAKLIDHFFTSGRTLGLVLLLLDSRHKPSADDMVMLDFLKESGIPFFAVLTKTDKLGKSALAQQIEYFRELLERYEVRDVVPFTVNGGESAGQLREKIKEYFVN